MPDVDVNLLDPPAEPSADSLISPEPKKPLKLRKFGDIAATRQAIYDQALDAANTMAPVSNARHTLSLQDAHWDKAADFGKTDSKRAILGGGTLNRRLKGTWVLT